MKSNRAKSSEPGSESGSAMIGVLLLTIVSSMLVASVLQYTTHEAKTTHRSLDFQKSQVAAETALQFGIRELRREALKHRLFPDKAEMQVHLDARLSGLNNVAAAFAPNYALQTEDGYHTLYIEAENDVVRDQPIGDGAYASWQGDRQNFTITAGARNPETGVASAYQIKAQLVSINMIRFAIFYEEDLEFLPGPNMDVRGPVHTNQDLYLQPVNNLNLHGRVRTAGDFIFKGKDGRLESGNVRIKTDNDQLLGVRNSGSDGQHLDSRNQNWTGEALERWQHQRFLSSAHNVQKLRPPIAPSDRMVDLIQRPRDKSSSEYQDLSDEEKNDWQTTEDEKFANRAAVTIHVDSSGNVTATNFYGDDITDILDIGAELVSSEEYEGEYQKNEDNGHYILNNNAAIDTSSRFRDGREEQTVASVDIYMDNLIDQLAEHLDVSDAFSNPVEDKSSGLLYVTRDTPNDGAMPAVRLRNGSEINSDQGLSLTSDNPLYVEGHFNREDPKPTMVAGDAVSMLSRKWQDAYSSDGHKHRPSHVDTEKTVYNTVVMTGNIDTIPGEKYNGGVENVFRFLEDWSGTQHVFRGSIICLWNSLHANSDWGDSYYGAPTRDWGYDDMYTTQSPPGMVRVFGLEELEWRRLTYEEAEEEFRRGPNTAAGVPNKHPGKGKGPDGTGPPGAENWPEPGGSIPEFPF